MKKAVFLSLILSSFVVFSSDEKMEEVPVSLHVPVCVMLKDGGFDIWQGTGVYLERPVATGKKKQQLAYINGMIRDVLKHHAPEIERNAVYGHWRKGVFHIFKK